MTTLYTTPQVNSIKCDWCGSITTKEWYQEWINGSKHFIVKCPKCGKHKQKRIDGLIIPYQPTKISYKRLSWERVSDAHS